MNRSLRLCSVLAALSLAVNAAVPPVAKLLPKDTLAVFTVPDWTQASADMSASPQGRLWADPAMKPFRDQFEKKFSEEVVGSLEKQLGIKVADYIGLMRGQVTLAIIQNDWKGESDTPGFLLVLDAKDQSDQLKSRLEEVRKKLADSKTPLKSEKIRDTQFSIASIDVKDDDDDDDDDDKAKDKDKAKTKKPGGKKQNIYFGQADSALLVADSAKTLEKVMASIGGGTVPTLSEEPLFQSSEATWFKGSRAFGWIHFVPLYRVIADKAGSSGAGDAIGVDAKAALKAIGLEGLKTISMAWNINPEGSGASISLSIPEAQRVGLFKMLAIASKEAGPLPFVPADVVKFQRWRLDGQKMWSTLEETVAAVSPQFSGFIQLMISQAGKDKDPSFDLKKNLVGNLGDDVVSYAKAPKGKSLEDLMSQPSVMLLGSANPDALTAGVKVAGGALGAGGDDVKDREFNGKKVRGIRMPSTPGAKNNRMEMASSAGYAVFSSTPALLEEVIRSAESPTRSLKDDPAIAAAAQKVGGLNTGMFGYENTRESMRGQWEFLRSGELAKLMNNETQGWGELFSAKYLPEFEKVSKHFGIAVFSGSTDAQGTHFRFYGPTPK
jgi:hypothetical protein